MGQQTEGKRDAVVFSFSLQYSGCWDRLGLRPAHLEDYGNRYKGLHLYQIKKTIECLSQKMCYWLRFKGIKRLSNVSRDHSRERDRKRPCGLLTSFFCILTVKSTQWNIRLKEIRQVWRGMTLYMLSEAPFSSFQILAAAFWTTWRLLAQACSRPENKTLQLTSLDKTKALICVSHGQKRPNFSYSMLGKWNMDVLVISLMWSDQKRVEAKVTLIFLAVKL